MAEIQTWQAKRKELLEKIPLPRSKVFSSALIFPQQKRDKESIFTVKGDQIPIMQDLAQQLKDNISLIRYIEQGSQDYYSLLNDANFNEGKYIEINKSGEYSIEIESLNTSLVKNLIFVKENVSCSILFSVKGTGSLNLINHISTEPKSNCKITLIDAFSGNSVIYQKGIVSKQSNLNLFFLSNSKSQKKALNELNLQEDSASGNIFSAFSCAGSLELSSKVYCQAQNHNSLVLTKGIVNEQGKALIEGYAKIAKNASKTDLFVGQHALLLSKQAQVHLVPNLEIENDNVKAGHAASVETLQEEKLFYLTSRGISLSESRILLINAFLQSVIDKMDLPKSEQLITEGVLQ